MNRNARTGLAFIAFVVVVLVSIAYLLGYGVAVDSAKWEGWTGVTVQQDGEPKQAEYIISFNGEQHTYMMDVSE